MQATFVSNSSDLVQEAWQNWELAKLNRPCTEFSYSALTQFCQTNGWLRRTPQWVALARESIGNGVASKSELPVHDDFGLDGLVPPPTVTVVVYLTAPEQGGGLDLFASRTSPKPLATVSIQPCDSNHKRVICISHGTWHRPAPHVGLRQALVYTEVTEPYWSREITHPDK